MTMALEPWNIHLVGGIQLEDGELPEGLRRPDKLASKPKRVENSIRDGDDEFESSCENRQLNPKSADKPKSSSIMQYALTDTG